MKTIGPRSLSSVLKLMLDVAFYLSFVGALVLVVFFAIILTRGADQLTVTPPVMLELDPESYQVTALDRPETTARIEEVEAMMVLKGVDSGYFLAGSGLAAILLGVLIVVLHKLRAVFRTLKEGNPFVRENAARIRVVGLAVIVAELMETLWLFWNSVYLKTALDVTGFRFRATFEPDKTAIFAGLTLLIVAEVFRLGAKLKEEQDLTV